MIDRRGFLAAGLSSVIAGCNSQNNTGGISGPVDLSGSWKSVGNDHRNSGRFDGTLPRSVTRDWKNPLRHEPMMVGSPILTDDHLFIGTEDGIASLNPEQGNSSWISTLSGSTAAIPAATKKTILVPQDSYGVYYSSISGLNQPILISLETDSGEVQWKANIKGTRIYSPTIHNESVFIQSDEFLYSIDINNGDVNWEVPKRTKVIRGFEAYRMRSAPAVSDSVAIYLYDDGLLALNTADGSISWQKSLGTVFSAPVLDKGMVFISARSESISTKLIALNGETGKIEWQSEGRYFNSPAIDDKRVYTADGQGIMAHDRKNGKKQWCIENDETWTPPICVGETLLVDGGGTALRAIDSGTGDELWQVNENSFYGNAVGYGGIYSLIDSPEGPLLHSYSDAVSGSRQE